MKPLSRADKLVLLRLAGCSSMGTGDWRCFVPLSNRGLVDMADNHEFGRVFGGSYRSVRLTDAGQVVLADVLRDVSIWHRTACAHAARPPRGTQPGRRCLCPCCTAAWMMRPLA